MSSSSHIVFLSMLKSLSFDEKKAQKIDAKRFGQKTEDYAPYTFYNVVTVHLQRAHIPHGCFSVFWLCALLSQWQVKEYDKGVFTKIILGPVSLLHMSAFFGDPSVLLWLWAHAEQNNPTTDNWQLIFPDQQLYLLKMFYWFCMSDKGATCDICWHQCWMKISI